MVIKTHSDSSDKDRANYVFYRKAGRSLIERRPIFSPDGESVLIIVEDIVRVYNIHTGHCVRTMETEKPVKELVAVQFPDDESYNVIACSDDGHVTTWTWDNGAVLRETHLIINPQDSGIITFNLLNSNECYVTTTQRGCNGLYSAIYSVKNGTLVHDFGQTHHIGCEDMIRVAVGRCQGDRFAAITNGTPSMVVQNLDKPAIKTSINNISRLRYMSVAAHQSESMIAAVDTLGRLVVLRGYLFDYKCVAREVMHWHSLPAIDVCFSLQGSYIYTGGLEKVLVKWMVGSLAHKAGQKEFIPRLPGIVRYVTAHKTHVAITLANNSVILANAQLRVLTTILECGGLSPAARTLSTPLVYHSRLNGLLLGGRTGHLQLYSTASDKVLYTIDVTQMNSTPAEKNNLIPLETEVACAAVSGNGSWLVTSEYRNDGLTYTEEKLKFWAFDVNHTPPFTLNTYVNLSHGGCRVVSLALNPQAHICVSAGTDQKLRVWKRERATLQSKKNVENRRTFSSRDSWKCLTACYYSSGTAQFLSHPIFNNYKNGGIPPEQQPYLKVWDSNDDIVRKLVNIHKQDRLLDENVSDVGFRIDEDHEMGGVAVSLDASLMAAWFGCKLTLWDTHLCNLRTTLSHPALRPKGVLVKFGGQDAAHYLVCTTETCVAVWSLLSSTVKWMVPLRATGLTAQPFSNKMALVTDTNDVYVFTPHSSSPILVRKRLLDPKSGVFKQCTFGNPAGNGIRLYVSRNDSEIYCLEPEESREGKLEVISRRNLPTSNFGALVAEQTLSEVQHHTGGAVYEVDSNALGDSALNQFLSAAPHMLPPISLLCTPLLMHIAGHKEPEDEPEHIEDPQKEIDASSDEENDVVKTKPEENKPTQLWTPNYEKIKEKRLQKISKEALLDIHTAEQIFGL